MRTLLAVACLVLISALVGCASQDSTPASQAQVNNVTKTFQTHQSSSPDVPLELRNKGVSPGTGIRKGGK